jgi:ribose transport system substrate-binding protein
MRRRTLLMTAVAIGLFATIANAAGDKMTIAVFAKNLTNPAYEAFRIASDQIAHSTGAQVVHYVPKHPDNVDEQKAMVEQVLNTRPDARNLRLSPRCNTESDYQNARPGFVLPE